MGSQEQKNSSRDNPVTSWKHPTRLGGRDNSFFISFYFLFRISATEASLVPFVFNLSFMIPLLWLAAVAWYGHRAYVRHAIPGAIE